MAWCRISPPLTAVLELSELLELLELLALVLITHIPGHLQGSTLVAWWAVILFVMYITCGQEDNSRQAGNQVVQLN